MGLAGRRRAQGTRGGNRKAKPKGGNLRRQTDDDACGIRPVGSEIFVLPRLRAGDFRFREVWLPSGPAVGSGAVRGGSVAAENSHRHPESNTPRRDRTTAAGQRRRPPVEIFLRNSGQTGPAHILAVRQPQRTVFGDLSKISDGRNAPRLWL